MSSQRTWLERYFQAENLWDLAKIQGSGYPPDLQHRLQRLLEIVGKGQLPIALPRLDQHRQLSFYFIADGERQFAEIIRILQAYLGRVRTRLAPQVQRSSANESEEVLLEGFPQGFLKVEIPKGLNHIKSEVYSVFDSISGALDRYAQRPKDVTVVRRHIGRILHDFFVACDRQDPTAAREFLAEARASGKLNTRNLLSLELQAYAAGSEWRSLLLQPQLPDLLSGRVPTVVSAVILDAIGRTIIECDQPARNDKHALEEKLERFDTLFRRRPGFSGTGNILRWRTWAIGSAALGNQNVLDDLPAESVGDVWIDDLASWAQLKAGSGGETANLSRSLEGTPSLEQALILIKKTLSGSELDSLAIYRRLCEYPESIIRQIEKNYRLRRVWETLKEEFDSQADIDGWLPWLRSLTEDGGTPLSLQQVSEASQGWNADEWNEDVVIDLLFSLAEGDRAERVRDVLPILMKWLVNNEIQTSARFSEQLLFILAADESRSMQDLSLVSDLIRDITAVSHTVEQYTEAVDRARDIWAEVASVRSLDLGLEVMDTLMDSPCRDEGARQAFWAGLQGFCLKDWKRIADEHRLLVIELSEELLGTSEQFGESCLSKEKTDGAWPDLADRRLAIYTLTEGAARRARAVLGKIFPSLDIRINNDKTATSALVNLAKTADYFIFASQSASHQAFYPVTKERDDILYPAGKGSSSIVRCFLNVIEA